MCGITGLYSKKNDAIELVIKEMTNSIAHRGPDAKGTFHQGQFALGHRRLSIIDLSEEANQPMHSVCNRYTIVFNGEAYNYKELAKSENLTLTTSSDTEVLLQLFIKDGPNFIEKVNGMFALAIFDKEKEELYVYRDRLGIKPLFFFHDEHLFAFGSELKALMAHPYIAKNKTIHKSSIHSFLQFGYIPEPDTIYNKIHKFPSGHYFKISKNEVLRTEYWNSKDAIEPKTINNFQDAKTNLDLLINQSVALRLRSDVDFGAFLSGGIDSSLVSAIAQQHVEGKLKTFTIAFDDPKHNEAHFAKKVADYLKTDHHEFKVTEQDALELMDQILDITDEPFADSSLIPTLMVSKLARQHVKMTLSGDGGDELFMGYGAYNWAKRLSNPMAQLFRYPAKEILAKGNSRMQRVSHLFDYTSPKNLHQHIFSQEQYFFSEKELDKLLIERSDSNFHFELNSFNRKLNSHEKQAFYDLNCYLKDDLLVKVDRASMFHGLESRVPLLDHNIVEFALNVNDNLKIKGTDQKYLLKQVLYDYVPKEYFDRPKWGFSIPLNKWLKKDLRYLIDQYLSKEIIEQCNVVHYDYVKTLKDLYLDKNVDYLYNRIWVLILLHRFLIKL